MYNKSVVKQFKAPPGFTLIEVVITLGILTTMMVAVTTLLRSSFDVRFALSDEAKLTTRINTAMAKISEDLTHAYIISSTDAKRNYNDRTTKSIFRIEKVIGGGDKIAFTTMSNKPLKYNSHESDSAYVVYEVQEAKNAPGRKHLYRGSTGKIPDNFKEDPPMRLLASHIKGVTYEFWNGDGWSKDPWSSERSDTKDLLPHMVKISIEAWEKDVDETEGDTTSTHTDSTDLTITYSTVIFLPYSSTMKELKSRPTTPKI